MSTTVAGPTRIEDTKHGEVFPRPSIPLWPVLSGGTPLGRFRTENRSILEAGPPLLVSSGSAAIALALHHSKLEPGQSVLVPSYHCSTMIKPVAALKGVPVFFRIHPDLSVDIRDIERKLDRTTRALLIPHYFGFHQDVVALRSLCDRHELVLIEDCAHAFYGCIDGRPVGWFGDYAIASTRKFFPGVDGGLLVSSRRDLSDIRLEAVRFPLEFKLAVNVLEEAFASGRLRLASVLGAAPLYVKDFLWNEIKRRHATSTSQEEPDNSGAFTQRMSLVSQLGFRAAAEGRVVERRRANYVRLAAELSNVPWGRPLQPDLPDSVVPYMFPFLLDRPESHFRALKQRGMPICRWDDINSTECAHSASYAQQLIQIPCHQELRRDEISTMIRWVKEVLAPESMTTPGGR